MAISDVFFTVVDENVDLRDVANRVYKDLAIRLTTIAQDKYNKATAVEIAVDPRSNEMFVRVAVEADEEADAAAEDADLAEALKAEEDAVEEE